MQVPIESPRFPKKLVRIAFSVGGLVFLLSAGLSTPQDQITSYEERLKKISVQIDDLRKKIRYEEKRESTILSRLQRIGLQKDLTRKEISLNTVRLQKANQELRAISDSIPPLEAKLEEEKEAVAKTLVTLYKYGHLGNAELLLHVEDLGSLITDSKHLSLLAREQNQIVSGYLATLGQLEEARAAQEAKSQEIARLLQTAQQKQQELRAQEKQNRILIDEIAQNKQTFTQAIAEQQDRARELQDLISKLASREISLPIPIIPLYEKKGALSWPIQGRVVTMFGLQRHPLFKTVTVNNGIEIAPRDAIVVKSVHPGMVVYCDYFTGYGNLLIIDHGLTYYSLYGHCSEFYVEKGNTVPAEHPIAKVGDIGSLKGDTLYFEIRYKRKPLNPLQWLK